MKAIAFRFGANLCLEKLLDMLKEIFLDLI